MEKQAADSTTGWPATIVYPRLSIRHVFDPNAVVNTRCEINRRNQSWLFEKLITQDGNTMMLSSAAAINPPSQEYPTISSKNIGDYILSNHCIEMLHATKTIRPLLLCDILSILPGLIFSETEIIQRNELRGFLKEVTTADTLESIIGILLTNVMKTPPKLYELCINLKRIIPENVFDRIVPVVYSTINFCVCQTEVTQDGVTECGSGWNFHSLRFRKSGSERTITDASDLVHTVNDL